MSRIYIKKKMAQFSMWYGETWIWICIDMLGIRERQVFLFYCQNYEVRPYRGGKSQDFWRQFFLFYC
jgi:hypothetical protein